MKSLLELAGFEDVDSIKPVRPEELTQRVEKPEQMKNWGISAHEN